MKLQKTFLILCCLPLFSVAQSIEGDWNGTLKVPGAAIPLIFHISKSENRFTSTFDSPSQGAKGIPISETSLQDSMLNLNLSGIGASYLGKWSGDAITGNFTQGGQVFPLSLQRGAAFKVDRPQEPKRPFPYYSEDVVFRNSKANIQLSGTFTVPDTAGKFPAVILISGSGPQNRDGELAGHKPFLVLSDYLTRNGIAVLRFDDRGTGASEGLFASATTSDFATDVEAAVTYLKSRNVVDVSKIGLIGHSEGGLLAPMVATSTPGIAYIVLLAGPGVTGERILSAQSRLIAKAGGSDDQQVARTVTTNKKIYQTIKETADIPTLRAKLTAILEDALQSLSVAQRPPDAQQKNLINQQVNSLTTPWFRYFLTYEPSTALTNVKCPVLALNGSNDLQVPAAENLVAIQSALEKGGNGDVTIKLLPGINHLFQESATGLPNEYSSIVQTFSPAAMTEISNWIVDKTK